MTEDERSELARLRRENLQLQMERDILKKSYGLFRPAERVAFALIATEKALYPVDEADQLQN